MNQAEKMILIPKEAIDRMQDNRSDVANLDKMMNDILKTKNLSDDEKWNKYNQVLKMFLFRTEKYRQPIKLPISEASEKEKINDNKVDNVKHLLMSTVPEKYKEKASQLYMFLKEKSEINWDSNGFVKINGTDLRGSNIIDLINDILRHRKNSKPSGWQNFALTLRALNTPETLIGNAARSKYIRDNYVTNYTFQGQTGTGYNAWRPFYFKR
jgi:hypothetical protein